MILFASVLLLIAPAQNRAERPHPVDAIRKMLDRGDFADAAEAIDGLPDVIRVREEAYLYYRLLDAPATRERAEKAVAIEANNAEMLRVLSSAHAMEGRYALAAEGTRRAAAALDLDARLTDAERAIERRRLDDLNQFIRTMTSYREEVDTARSRAGKAAAGTALLLCIVAAASFWGAMRGR